MAPVGWAFGENIFKYYLNVPLQLQSIQADKTLGAKEEKKIMVPAWDVDSNQCNSIRLFPRTELTLAVKLE